MHFQFNHKRTALIVVSFVLTGVFLLYGLHHIAPTDRESYHTRLLEEMEHASSFSEFTDALFRYEASTDSITTAYSLKDPSSCQIPELAATLTTFNLKEYEKRKKEQSEEKTMALLLELLGKFDVSEMNEQERITYSLLQKELDLNRQLAPYAYYEDLLGSSNGVQANLPVTLGEYPLYTEENVKTYLSLLPQIPDYFRNVIAYERHRTELGYQAPSFLLHATKDGLEQMLEGFEQEDNCLAATFEERLRRIPELSSKQREAYETCNRNHIQKYVLPAYRELYAYVEEMLTDSDEAERADGISGASRDSHSASSEAADQTTVTTANVKPASTTLTGTRYFHIQLADSDKGSYSVNKEYIPKAGIPYGLSSLPDGAAYYALLVKSNTGSDRSVPELIQMTEQTLKQTLGTVLQIALTDQPAYLYYVDHPLETCYESPDSILQVLSLMIREDYPILTNTPSYEIKSVPDSLASFLSPAFYMIPALDAYEDNTIYINALYTNTEKGNLFTTLAHEGFPGHLYQTVYFHEADPLPIRHLIDYPGYVEGWATYAEINSFAFLDYPLDGDSLRSLYQSDTIINLALCSRIDLGVNYENWTIEDVDQFFHDNGFNSYYAADVYSYVVEAPATYLRYFIGYLEILELKNAYRNEQMEAYTEKDFHKALLDAGPGDFGTIRTYILQDDGQSPTK
ncbi:MAG: DUF885 domain-containing protein [Lachnospiraceae bacterium]|nr:DUF885 domain-containing protein [Lachnospiraceae bacterium]